MQDTHDFRAMDDDGRPRWSPETETTGRGALLRTLLAGLHASPAEVAGLALLVIAALGASGLLALAAGGSRQGNPVGASPQVPVSAALAGRPDVRVESDPSAAVVVHVVGRVAAPGVYRVPAGARVADALAAAGGAVGDAALESLNLARLLDDGEQVVVRALGDRAASPPGEADGRRSAVRPDGRLDLNLARAEDLEQLPGVGPVLAERVIAHRQSLGGRFEAVGQLRDVPGIGEAKFQAVAELVDV